MRKVEICGVNTSSLPILSGKEMTSLFMQMQNGDEGACEKIVSGNLRLVLSVVQRFANRCENPDDLFQVGCIGLIKAVKNFDLNQQVKFSTYGVPMILGEIRRYLRDDNSIRVSRSVRDVAYKALQTRDELSIQNGKEPTISEIATKLGFSKQEIVAALDAIQDPVSLFEPIFDDGGDPIYVIDQIKDDKNTDVRWINCLAVNDALKALNGREKKIIDMRFFSGKTQMEVAEEIGISQAQVSRLEKSALAHLRKYV